MARVNVGISPEFLSDQHLIAESVEITMITGSLRKNDYRIKSPIPDKLKMGTGYINFFKNKIWYLAYRLEKVNEELLLNRGITMRTEINCQEFPEDLVKYWEPTMIDSLEVRNRVYDRLLHPLRAKPGFHKYRGKPIEDMQAFAEKMLNSKLYKV